MNKRQQDRVNRLLPGGEPRWVRIYDNGGLDEEGGTSDRYTVVFTGVYTRKTGGEHHYIGMSGAPYYPQGICQTGSFRYQIDTNKHGFAPAMGRKCHLGKRISFSDLPDDCKHVTLRDYAYLWDLPFEVVKPLLLALKPSIQITPESLV